MAYGDRKSERVIFDRGVPVYMMGIDGTWRRACKLIDVSQTGARLHIEGSLEGLDLKEFFLLLSSTGLAYRRCQLVRVAGAQIGIEFLARAKNPRKKQPQRGRRFNFIEDARFKRATQVMRMRQLSCIKTRRPRE